jgi:hypothetical protein
MATTFSKTTDGLIYLVAHAGENPTTKAGFLLMEAASEEARLLYS